MRPCGNCLTAAITLQQRIDQGRIVLMFPGQKNFVIGELRVVEEEVDALGVGRFAKIGIPEPATDAPFVGVVEIVFGAFILLGFLDRKSVV